VTQEWGAGMTHIEKFLTLKITVLVLDMTWLFSEGRGGWAIGLFDEQDVRLAGRRKWSARTFCLSCYTSVCVADLSSYYSAQNCPKKGLIK
jgi:hypothetical protein